jgi:hypothetical protein
LDVVSIDDLNLSDTLWDTLERRMVHAVWVKEATTPPPAPTGIQIRKSNLREHVVNGIHLAGQIGSQHVQFTLIQCRFQW